jgi:hypothetical protein
MGKAKDPAEVKEIHSHPQPLTSAPSGSRTTCPAGP